MPAEAQRRIREEAAAVGAPTLTSFVFENLRRDIIAGIHAPGEKLRVEHIRAEFGVAASTMREALARLVSEGLVTAEGQRGFRVAPMSLEDLRDITRLRLILETESLVESIRAGDVAWECQVVAAFHNLTRAEERVGSMKAEDFSHWEECNKEFHRALGLACASPRLQQLVEILYRQHERYRFQSMMRSTEESRTFDNTRLRRNVHAEHEALMKAALDRNEDAARRILADHIQTTADTFERRLTAAAGPKGKAKRSDRKAAGGAAALA